MAIGFDPMGRDSAVCPGFGQNDPRSVARVIGWPRDGRPARRTCYTRPSDAPSARRWRQSCSLNGCRQWEHEVGAGDLVAASGRCSRLRTRNRSRGAVPRPACQLNGARVISGMKPAFAIGIGTFPVLVPSTIAVRGTLANGAGTESSTVFDVRTRVGTGSSAIARLSRSFDARIQSSGGAGREPIPEILRRRRLSGRLRISAHRRPAAEPNDVAHAFNACSRR